MKLQKEGNIKDKASTIRSLMGGLKDFGNGMKDGDKELMNPELSKMMENIPSLDNFEMDMATDEHLVEMFTHVLGLQDLDRMIEHTEGMKELSRTLTDFYSDVPLNCQLIDGCGEHGQLETRRDGRILISVCWGVIFL